MLIYFLSESLLLIFFLNLIFLFYSESISLLIFLSKSLFIAHFSSFSLLFNFYLSFISSFLIHFSISLFSTFTFLLTSFSFEVLAEFKVQLCSSVQGTSCKCPKTARLHWPGDLVLGGVRCLHPGTPKCIDLDCHPRSPGERGKREG